MHHTKIAAEFEFEGHSTRRGAHPPKMWRFAELRRMTQNVNKAMRAGKTSHRMQRAHSTCLQLRPWENQRRLSSLTYFWVIKHFCNDRQYAIAAMV